MDMRRPKRARVLGRLAISPRGAGVAVLTAALSFGLGHSLRAAPSGLWQLLLAAISISAGVLALAWWSALAEWRRERRALKRIHDERELLIESIDVTPTPFALYDRNDLLVAFNSSYRELHEPAFSRLSQPIRYADLMREVARQTLPPEAVEQAVAERVAIQAQANGFPADRIYPGGRWLRVSKKRTRSGGIAGFASDITELKQREVELAESEARFRALSETSPMGLWQIDATGAPLYANPALIRLLDLPPDTTAKSETLSALLVPVSTVILATRDCAARPERFETRIATAAGEKRDVLVAATAWLKDRAGHPACVATIVDITELKAAQARVEHLATHDALTGLGNRTRFAQALRSALADAADDGMSVALLAIDLDHFKQVNDRLGHASGDMVLCAAAQRMRAATRNEDLICRLGGDEFAVVVKGETQDIADEIADRLLGALSSPFGLGGEEMSVGASIGIASFPEDAVDVDTLLRNADLALYRAKHRGRCGIARYAEADDQVAAA